MNEVCYIDSRWDQTNNLLQESVHVLDYINMCGNCMAYMQRTESTPIGYVTW